MNRTSSSANGRDQWDDGVVSNAVSSQFSFDCWGPQFSREPSPEIPTERFSNKATRHISSFDSYLASSSMKKVNARSVKSPPRRKTNKTLGCGSSLSSSCLAMAGVPDCSLALNKGRSTELSVSTIQQEIVGQINSATFDFFDG